MSSEKLVIGSIALVVTGFSLGWTLRGPVTDSLDSDRSSSVVENSSSQESLLKLQQLTERDLEEYSRLKSLEEKYLKADEILAKMMGLFLTDLGSRVSPRIVQASKQSPAKIEASPSSVAVSPVNTLASAPAPAEVGRANPAKPGTPAGEIARVSLEDLRADQDYADFLKASQIKDFDESLKSSNAFSGKASMLNDLAGRYSGTSSVLTEGRAVTWGVEFDFTGSMVNGRLTGEYSFSLSENGKAFSVKSGNGSLDNDFREISSDPQATIIEVSPSTYAQIYYLKRGDAIIGNLIKRTRLGGPFQTIGTFHLTRR